jgi:hypothetical protein
MRAIGIAILALTNVVSAQQTAAPKPVQTPGRAIVILVPAQGTQSLPEPQSCTEKGFLRISFFGNDQNDHNAISVKFQLVDPKGRHLGPKYDSEETLTEIPGGNFDWEALDDDEDPNAPPAVPSGVFELCNPESGVYRLEGKGMLQGYYDMEISAYSEEIKNQRGFGEAKQFYKHIKANISSGTAHTILLRYNRSQSEKIEVIGEP